MYTFRFKRTLYLYSKLNKALLCKFNYESRIHVRIFCHKNRNFFVLHFCVYISLYVYTQTIFSTHFK